MGVHREIGGYFEFERFKGEPYHRGAVALNSGRGCLSYLVELRGIRTIWVPDLMCDSVPTLLRRDGAEVRTYPINEAFLPDYESFEIGRGEWMLLMDYYGQLQGEDVETARAACGGRLVVDESQGFFRKPWGRADTTYTCRKWFGVADGGYLATGDGARLARALPRDESHLRMSHVLGRLERPAGEFFAESSANNERFADEPAKAMSPITKNILRAVDYDGVRTRRNANWDCLSEALGGMNRLSLRRPECAFMYPLCLFGDTQALRKRLIEEKIFIPMLWPNVPAEQPPDCVARQLAESILPLPVDQRYGSGDMSYLAEEVIECLQ